eukprot:scaffold108697_cov36-Phaeocystis_antarctica.AAC.2
MRVAAEQRGSSGSGRRTRVTTVSISSHTHTADAARRSSRVSVALLSTRVHATTDLYAPVELCMRDLLLFLTLCCPIPGHDSTGFPLCVPPRPASQKPHDTSPDRDAYPTPHLLTMYRTRTHTHTHY